MAWQVEHNGAWRVELGERLRSDDRSSLVLGLFGPTDADHAWLRTLEPGGSFTSVPVSVAFSNQGWVGAVAELTKHRRTLRDASRRPAVVFNDYMNTLMGDPTTEKLEPLIRSAASVGAEYFCIDAGWYDDGGDWWDSVGQWEPSTKRFPGRGLGSLLQQIREAGMVPGLWLEPEVVGIRSPIADQLPDDAFLQRRGVRIVEQGRYLLDMRSEDAVKHLDAVVDRMVDDLGVGYLKLDYNVTPGAGTDRAADSPGDGLLSHNRAHLAWIDGVRARHPHLVIENCASGAMRADYAMLARMDLQSTSDQQDPLRYPPIAAGALLSILPEQAANWAYPQPDMTEDELVFTMCTGLSGLLYLSGRLDEMDERQRALVREGVSLARRWADQLQQAVPIWPLGLPGWTDPWVAVGLRAATETLVAVWWRGDAHGEVVLDLPAGSIETAYPSSPAHPWHLTTDSDGRTRIRVLTHKPQARILRIAHNPLA
ncbi:glycoside hydrolase family 36 protein [Cellulomonas sp. KRMCY2]|uniref:glycoside hydrolase family 36 protein n=1 Tax=Cellulomonas sp. KRMCY2 TaxID=1304865 RepID=UPI0018CC00F9|nr:glycoside hydrolase family 36 protein [Cellulomonas sp. KRMCY2]